MVYFSKLTPKILLMNAMMQSLLIFMATLMFQLGLVDKHYLPFIILPLFCWGSFMWLKSNVIRVSNDGISSGIDGLNKLQWSDIGTVKWNEAWAAVYVSHSNPVSSSVGSKRIACYFPIKSYESFRADVMKYAPEGNPLRVWVESEQFEEIHNK